MRSVNPVLVADQDGNPFQLQDWPAGGIAIPSQPGYLALFPANVQPTSAFGSP
jgi:hypothetical protein